MTSGLGDSVETALMDLVFSGTAYPYGPASRLSLHTASPGASGANELVNAGGSTYARQACSWGAAVAGVVTLAANVDFFNLPAVTVTHAGVWTTLGQFVGSADITDRVLALGDGVRVNNTVQFTMARAA